MLENITEPLSRITRRSEQIDDIVEYYDKTSADYEGWSKSYNMHFGYFRYRNPWQCLRDIWRLEPQLKQTNIEVFQRLNIRVDGNYLDMGCGLGATAREFARRYPTAQLTGITITPVQVTEAQRLLDEHIDTPHRVNFAEMDYQHTAFEANHFDGVYALESACHGKGRDRRAFIAEAYRVLKPGGRLVIHDALVRQPTETGNPLFRYCYRWLCQGWATENYIDKTLFENALKRQGFKNITVTNAFWHVLPSALHMPRVIAVYAVRKMLLSKRFYTDKALRKQRIYHCLGSIAAIFVSLHFKRFGYFVITANKPQALDDAP